MSVASLHPAPPCDACRERPAACVQEVDPAAIPRTVNAPVRLLPAVVRLLCAPCFEAHHPGGQMPPGMRGARLSAGMLAALAAARPRCAVMTCTAHVGRWGATCDACGDRSEAAVEGDLAATAARKLGARNLRRREGRRKHHAPTAGQDTDPNP